MDDVIVIGAGVAGLVCAQRLQRAGYRVVVVDKSRGLGGRLATRRATVNDQAVCFNHGVQYITAETDGFHRFLRNLSSQGVLQEWARALHCLDASGLSLEPVDAQKVRYVAEPGMNAIAKYLARDLECVLDSRIIQLQHIESGWLVQAESGQQWTAPALVLALPAPQIVPLLSTVLPSEHSLLQLVQSVAYAPSLAVMAAYIRDTAPAWKGIKWLADPQIAWLAAHHSESLTTVVLHTTAALAQAHLDEQPERLWVKPYCDGQRSLSSRGWLSRCLFSSIVGAMPFPLRRLAAVALVQLWVPAYLPVPVIGVPGIELRVPISQARQQPRRCNAGLAIPLCPQPGKHHCKGGA